MLKFPLDQSKTVDAKTVGAFVDDFAAGKIAPSVKSEPVPKTQSGPVYVLVADEFDKVVADTKKDLLVECACARSIHSTDRSVYAPVRASSPAQQV